MADVRSEFSPRRTQWFCSNFRHELYFFLVCKNAEYGLRYGELIFCGKRENYIRFVFIFRLLIGGPVILCKHFAFFAAVSRMIFRLWQCFIWHCKYLHFVLVLVPHSMCAVDGKSVLVGRPQPSENFRPVNLCKHGPNAQRPSVVGFLGCQKLDNQEENDVHHPPYQWVHQFYMYTMYI